MQGFSFLPLLLLSFYCYSQPVPTSPLERMQNVETRKNLASSGLLNQIPLRSIGPTVMSGRVVDLDVNPEDPTEFYVAYASGGLWYTNTNGQSFQPCFDQESVMTIGDIAVDWKSSNVWVGTGENNSSRSSYSGDGIYLSKDRGRTWQHKGLSDSHHIGRIVIDPSDPNRMYVAVLGHLYTSSSARGVYTTSDGGANWQNVLFVNDNTGAIDLILDPNDNKQMYAALWDKSRTAWNLNESGVESSIYKSSDSGQSWLRLESFNLGEGCGRIGLAMSKGSDGKNYVYAVVDNQNKRPKDPKQKIEDKLTTAELKNMTKEQFLALPDKKIKSYLSSNNFPEKYSVKEIRNMIVSNKITVPTIAEYTEDANSALFNSDEPIIGAEVYCSTDDGKTWQKKNQKYLNGVYNTYGYYFAQIRVEAGNHNRVFILGYPLLSSKDGGQSWSSMDANNMHVDHHALWVNDKKPGHLINGNDGGVNISYNYGKTWTKCNSPAVGQFYAVAVDNADPYNVYGGLQDNGVWVGSSNSIVDNGWQHSGENSYKELLGGDGMQVAIDNRDNSTVYTGFQFGNYFKINTKTKSSKFITPKHELNERPLRFNWQTPIQLSTHNQDVIYMGAQRLYRSLNQGKKWDPISLDLTNGGQKGDVPFGTLTSISESPLKFGLIYTGSDDGKISFTKDGGEEWLDITSDLPKGLWVSRITASSHEKSRVFVSLNGYRNDHFTPYLYISNDFGKKWKNIAKGLPTEAINVIREDPTNSNLLYVGTDHGLYVSLDQGGTWNAGFKDLPATPVHDCVVQAREKELLIGTHGRSLYILRLKELQQLDSSILSKKIHIFPTDTINYSGSWGKEYASYIPMDTPRVVIPVFVSEPSSIKMSVIGQGDMVLYSEDLSLGKGLHYLNYHLWLDENIVTKYMQLLNKEIKKGVDPIEIIKKDDNKYYLLKGKYKVNFQIAKLTETIELVVD